MEIKQLPSSKRNDRALRLRRRKAAGRDTDAHAANARGAKASGRSRPRANGEPIDFGPLEHWIGFNLRMAQDASFQAFSRLSKKIGVKPGRFATLTLIGRNPGISQTALSRANGRDKSTLTPLLAFSGRSEIALPARGNMMLPTGEMKTRVVVQHPEDGIEDGHEVVFQTAPPKHEMRCFLEAFVRGDMPVVPASGDEDAPCQ